MSRLKIALLLGLCFCTARAAEPPAEAESEAARFIKIFRGQWTFLKSTTTFCAEQVPAMKREFERVREYAEDQMARAETIVLDETANSREGYKPLFDTYASTWTKYAAELFAAVKRQDPRKACPDLLSNWQTANADLILEDWRGFVERSDPVPQADEVDEAPHGA